MDSSSTSLLDILGPIMIGPSSSHTAGALRIGRAAGMLCTAPVVKAVFRLHGSFASTYKGHGSDRALAAGVLGMQTDDPDIKNALEICRQRGIEVKFTEADLGEVHPNTVQVELTDAGGIRHVLTGCSVGGGAVRIIGIDGFDTGITGEYPTIVTKHHDKVGVIKNVVSCISDAEVNIVTINLARSQKGKLATAIIETDTLVDGDVVEKIGQLEHMVDVLTMDKF